MTRQLATPIHRQSFSPTHRMAVDLYHQVENRRIVLDPPYQRGSVWTNDQRLDLMYSFLSGYPVGTLIFNDRMRGAWWKNGPHTVAYAVIDGKQRLETVCDWFRGDLAIPVSWVPAEFIEPSAAGTFDDFGDGPYLTQSHLNDNGERYFETAMSIPVVTAQVDTVHAEAEIYRLVNTGGTHHTAEELARASKIEKG